MEREGLWCQSDPRGRTQDLAARCRPLQQVNLKLLNFYSTFLSTLECLVSFCGSIVLNACPFIHQNMRDS